MELGLTRGYFPELEKSIVVCDSGAWEAVQYQLERFQFKLVDGHWYLGGFIGSEGGCQKWLEPKIQKWTKAVETVATVARQYPQTAYVGLVQSLQAEWHYLQHVMLPTDNTFDPVEQAIKDMFLPALFGEEAKHTVELQPLLTLSVHWAGIGILMPTTSGPRSHDTSKASMATLISSLQNGEAPDVAVYVQAATTN